MKKVKTISGPFDQQRYDEWKKAYDKAVENNQETFIIEGMIMVTKYVKYLLEYVKSEL